MSEEKSEEENSLPEVEERKYYRNNGKLNLAELLRLRYQRGFSLQEIADKIGGTKQAVYLALQRISAYLPSTSQVDAYRENRAAFLDAVETKLVAHMLDDEKLSKASINNLAFASRQITDMRRLETGQSTANINSITRLIEQSHADLVSDAKRRSKKAENTE